MLYQETCKTCGGDGQIITALDECPHCGGVIEHWETCENCDGHGFFWGEVNSVPNLDEEAANWREIDWEEAEDARETLEPD